MIELFKPLFTGMFVGFGLSTIGFSPIVGIPLGTAIVLILWYYNWFGNRPRAKQKE